MMKMLPYGLTDFIRIRTENYYYVDKTKYIESVKVLSVISLVWSKTTTTRPGSALQRLFITGISPVTMDDVTSRFNIGTNIATNERFNSLDGFNEQELRDIIERAQRR